MNARAVQAPDEVRDAARLAYIDHEGYGTREGHNAAADVAYAAGVAAGRLTDVSALLTELERTRALVEAARAWRAQFEKPASTKLPRMRALLDAVDELDRGRFLVVPTREN